VPEAAEVEIIRRGLCVLEGERLTSIVAHDGRFEGVGQDLVGERVLGARRHGKLLGLDFVGAGTLALHLRMTGSLSWETGPHLRATLGFDSGRELHFCDVRGFGTVKMVAREDFGGDLGPDVLDESQRLAERWEATKHSRRAIKAVLLDQAILAGVGNYMADESLFRARVSPYAPTRLVGQEGWESLCLAAFCVATESLEHGGVSMRDYRHIDGSKGSMQDRLLCYGHAGEPCPRCGTMLEHGRVGGRGTTHCPSCQPLPA
jgi:formamidopyrimidine-DNA glycosylase